MAFKEKRTVIFVIVVLAVFLTASYFRYSSGKPFEKDVYSLPLTFGQWEGDQIAYDRELLTTWLGTNHMIFRQYRNRVNGKVVAIYIAYYPTMEASDMAHSPEVCYPGQGWKIMTDNDITFDLLDRKVSINRLYIEKKSNQEVVYSWWQTSNKIFADNSWYHLAQIINRVSFMDTSSIWVRISAGSTTSLDNKNPDEDSLKAFIIDITPLLANYFQ